MSDVAFADAPSKVHSGLFDPDTKEIEPLGEDFANYAASLFVPFYDLELAELEWEAEGELVYGQPVRFDMRAKAHNWGNTDAPSVVLRWLRQSLSGSTELLEEENLPAVPLRWGGSVDGEFSCDTTIAGPIHIIAQLEASDDVFTVNTDASQREFMLDVNLSVTRFNAMPTSVVVEPSQNSRITLRQRKST